MTHSRLMLYFPAIGLLEGLAWGLLAADVDLVASEYWKIALVTGISTAAVGARLGWEHIARYRFWLGLAGLAVVAMLGSAYVWSQLPVRGEDDYFGDYERVATWFLFGGLGLLATLPFLQMAFSPASGRRRFAYAHWFDWSWRNETALATAAAFTAVATGIYFLWLVLLDFIGLARLAELLQENPMPTAVVGTAFGYGLVLTRMQTRFTSSFREIATSAAAALLVVIAFFMLMVLGSLPFTGMAPLWSTSHATPILLALTALFALALILTRGDDREPPYPAWLRYVVELATVLLPVFPMLAIYSTWLRVDQHGLSPDRVWALALSIMVLLYTLGIAASLAFRQKPWLYRTGHVNLALAAASIPLAIAMHSPWLDPMRLSVNDQVHRLLEGRVALEDLDIQTLRSRWGHAGRDKVEELRRLKDHPQGDEIRAYVERYIAAVEAGRRWPPKANLVGRGHIEPSEPNLEVPEGLWRAIEKNSAWLQHCRRKEHRCLLFAADITAFPVDAANGPNNEYCVLLDTWHPEQLDVSLCYGLVEADRWQLFARLDIPEELTFDEALEIFSGEGPHTEPARYRQLRFGEHILGVVPCCERMPEWWLAR